MIYNDLIENLRNESKYVLPSQTRKALIEAADAIEELSNTLEAYQDMTDMIVEEVPGKMAIRFEYKWIPVTERVPNPNVDVLVCTNGDISVDKYFGLILGKPAFLKKSYRVTHWMPLPKAPELSKEE